MPGIYLTKENMENFETRFHKEACHIMKQMVEKGLPMASVTADLLFQVSEEETERGNRMGTYVVPAIRMKIRDGSAEEMDILAKDEVRKWIDDHLDKSDPQPEYDVFIVWKCKTLQNWKYLISTTLPDGMYYEMTYDGDKHTWYLDAYKKFANRSIEEVPEEKVRQIREKLGLE